MVMRYGVLGPLEVRGGERWIEIRSAKQRALLAMLLLNANRVVSAGRLVDALWNDTPPETSAKGLQVHVSQLRKLLGHQHIETRPPGYVLRVGEGELDAGGSPRLWRKEGSGMRSGSGEGRHWPSSPVIDSRARTPHGSRRFG